VESSPKAVRAVLKVFARLIALAFGAALGGFGAYMMADSWAVPMAGAPIPEGMSYVGLAGGGALIALFALERLIFGDAPDPHHEAPVEA
jgi:TRAP-type C4-dicarboxylate transport system permease small subunit